MKLCLTVLAAGASRRLGRPKQLELIEGQPLIARTLSIALAASASLADLAEVPVAITLGAFRERCAAPLYLDEPHTFTVLDTPSWQTGMSASLHTAAAWATRQHADALAILLVDQHQLTPADLTRLLRHFITAKKPMAAATYQGDHQTQVTGVPAVFAKSLFPALAALEGDAGARTLLRAHPTRVATFPLPNAAPDLDTPLPPTAPAES